MEKRVCIVGAGIAGLTTCKHLLSKGLRPTVFEAEHNIGGVWTQTIASTRLQTPRFAYEFSDFPWPPAVTDMFPDHRQVLGYIESYAHRFDVLRHVRFGTKVAAVEYIGPSEMEMKAWELWAGNGEAFGGGSMSRGVWHVTTVKQGIGGGTTEVHQFDFLILCIGRFSGAPKIPTFPVNKGPEVFDGKVVHSLDYANMGSAHALQLIKGKRVAVVGFQKSAIDIAAECADANGIEHPCTIICRTSQWAIPYNIIQAVIIGYKLFANRLAELLVHKPGEGLVLSLLATFLSPLAWVLSKLMESYIKWAAPMNKYGMVPEHSFLEEKCSCVTALLPEKFYNRVEEGSIILKKVQNFSFYKDGIITDDDETSHIRTDIVIFGTGYKDEQKLKDIFVQPPFQKVVAGSLTTNVPLYRGCIIPQIPQLAVMGYHLSLANLYVTEMEAKWLAYFLDDSFRLPPIRCMQENVTEWEIFMKRYSGKYFKRSCVSAAHIWFNDQICRDVGRNPRRKKGFFADLFLPYGPKDYADL